MIRKLTGWSGLALLFIPYAVCYYAGRLAERMWKWANHLDDWSHPERPKLPKADQ